MYQLQFLLVVLGANYLITELCSGFILQQAKHNTSIDHAPNGDTQMMDANGKVRFAEISNFSRQAEKTIPEIVIHERPANVRVEKVDDGIHTSKIDIFHPSGLKNAILILLSNTDESRTNIWNELQSVYPASVKSYVQNCRNDTSSALQFSLGTVFLSGSSDNECDCEHYLRMSVAGLLLWARNDKGLHTGTISSTNLKLPSVLKYDEEVQHENEFAKSDEKRVQLNNREIASKTRDVLQPANHGDLSIHTYSSTNLNNVSTDKEEKPKSANGMWDVLREFTKIRFSIFRKLLVALSRNLYGSQNPLFPENSYPFESNLTKLVADTIAQLKSNSNKKGYILLVAVSEAELFTINQLLQDELSGGETQLVIMEVCSRDGNSVPFLADGPVSNEFRNAKTIWELPKIMRNVLASGHQNKEHRIQHHHMQLFPYIHYLGF